MFILKVGITGICVWILFEKIDLDEVKKVVGLTLQHDYWTYVFLAVLFVPVNWFLEAEKWRLLIAPIRKISRLHAMKPVLKGLALNWLLPLSMGDLLMRMAPFRNKAHVFRLIMINRVTSLMVTLIFGLVGIWFFVQHVSQTDFRHLWFVVVPAAILACVPLIWIDQRKLKAPLFSLSFLRYGVFSIQFMILLLPILASVPVMVIAGGVFWTFLLRSLVPSVLGALGIREVSAISYFSIWEVSAESIVVASLILWFVNIVLPSIVGMLLIWRQRFQWS